MSPPASRRPPQPAAKTAKAGGSKRSSRPSAAAASAKDRAMAMLARRAYSRQALRDRLVERFEEAEVESVLNGLCERGVVDDRDYAERFVRDGFERRGHGRHRIRRELLAHGVTVDDADAVIEELVEPEAERAAAVAALEKFRRIRATPSDPERARKDDQRAFRHLVARGFAADLARDLLGVSL